MDKVACDGQMCYLAESDVIGGLCEHSGTEFRVTSVEMGKNLELVIRYITKAKTKAMGKKHF